MSMRLFYSPSTLPNHWITNDLGDQGHLTTIRFWPFFFVWCRQ